MASTVSHDGFLHDAAAYVVEDFAYFFDVLGMDELKAVASRLFFRRESRMPLAGRRQVAQVQVFIENGNDVGRTLYECAETLFALRYRFFSALALRDIPGAALHAHRFPVPVNVAAADFNRNTAAIFSNDLNFVRRSVASSFVSPAAHGMGYLPVLGSDDVNHVHLRGFFKGVACELECGAVDPGEVCLQVLDVDHVIGILDQLAKIIHRFQRHP